MKMTTRNSSVGEFKLPQFTDIKENNIWVAIPRVSRTIPFGYEVDPEDEGILLPIADELDKLEMAKNYLKQYSYREVANWLTKHTGRTISHVGLMKRLKNERRRKNKVTSLRRWASYAQKALSKAAEIEAKSIGASSNKEDTETTST
jgi:hypothetical protein